MSKELDALNRLAAHLEKDFDTDNYVKSGDADKDIELIKSVLQDEFPTPPKDCAFNRYNKIAEVCEKCPKHETCARFNAIESDHRKAMNECYAMPYLEGRYTGD